MEAHAGGRQQSVYRVAVVQRPWPQAVAAGSGLEEGVQMKWLVLVGTG